MGELYLQRDIVEVVVLLWEEKKTVMCRSNEVSRLIFGR